MYIINMTEVRNVYKDKIMQKYINDPKYDTNPNYESHQIKTRTHSIIVGPTGAGKTNFLYLFLEQMSDSFSEIYIYTSTKNQAIYQCFEKEFGIVIKPLNEIIPHPQLEQKRNKLVIFDDFIDSKSKVLKEQIDSYAVSSRHAGVSVCYLVQNYYSLLPKIRNQCGYIILLHMANKKNLKMILGDMATDLVLQDFMEIVGHFTSRQFQFCFIDTTVGAKSMIRRNFDGFVDIPMTTQTGEIMYLDGKTFN